MSSIAFIAPCNRTSPILHHRRAHHAASGMKAPTALQADATIIRHQGTDDSRARRRCGDGRAQGGEPRAEPTSFVHRELGECDAVVRRVPTQRRRRVTLAFTVIISDDAYPSRQTAALYQPFSTPVVGACIEPLRALA